MKKLSTKQAAFLYLILFNIEEADDEKFEVLKFKAFKVLSEGGYPWKDIVFDHEGNPMIEWPEEFDYQNWVWEYLDGQGMHQHLELCFDDPSGVDLLRLSEITKPEPRTDATNF